MTKTIVFLGPTLDLAKARGILPDAVFLPPAARGDILRCTRLQPQNIVIIDGYFEKSASILHKEILFALRV